jgi:TolB-like protein/Flp pilus assembly protein TadD
VDNHAEALQKRGIVAELSHRHVLRAAAVYVGAVWALSQGIAQLAPVFNAPTWITRWFVIACAVGFPFWVAFAWYYKLTPEGFKREGAPGAVDPAFHRATGRKLDFWIIGVMAVAIVLLVTNTFVLHRDVNSAAGAADAQAIAAELAKVPFQSVAVLPLANQSGDSKQQYFSDGLSEELISDLTQVNGLKVIGSYSSFKFRDSTESPAQIGAALGVAHLILGSIQQQDNRIRVTVNMIRAKDGASVWSHSYDEQLEDVFAIQSRIGDAVAKALKIKLLGNPIVSSDRPPSGSVEAYKLMLQGHALVQHYTETGFNQGISLLEHALRIDPGYAYAWGVLSTALINQGQTVLSGEARRQAYAKARLAADKQQELAPDAADTYMARGYLLQNVDKDLVGALTEFKRAAELAPNDSRAMEFLAYGLASAGQLQPAIRLYEKAIGTNPLKAPWYATLSSILLGNRKLDAAETAARKALELQPGFPAMYANLAQIDILRGDSAAAIHDAALESDPTLGSWTRAMVQQINPDRKKADEALRDYIAKYGQAEPYFVADLYAVRKQPDEMFQWLDLAWSHHDPNFFSLLLDAFPLAYKDDPRFAALCRKAGLPVPGQPLPAMAGVTDQ